MDEMDNNVKQVLITEVSRPYKKIDVAAYDSLEVIGYNFPIEITNSKLEIKDSRELKPPATIDEMIGRLKCQEITFSNEEEVQAKEFLRSVNYYRLSVFRLFLSDDKSLTALKSLYNFDRFLRESINRLIPPVEVDIKTSLAYFLSNNYGNLVTEKIYPDALVYLDERIYKAKEVRNNRVNIMLSNFSRFITDKQEKEPMIKHHVEYYSGNIPIWVLIEQLTMGDLSTFITYLDTPIRKNWMRSSFSECPPKLIIEWMRTLQFLRNTGAHCSRFYSKYFNYNPTILEKDRDKIPVEHLEGNKKDRIVHSLFYGLLVLKNFYDRLPKEEKEAWEVFLNKLDKQIESNSNIKIQNMGFPPNWKNILELKN